MAEPVVAFFVVHWNQPERCLRTVQALQDQAIPVRVTVLDNGSEPELLTRLAEQLPAGSLVPLGSNLGFGPAANVGLRQWLDRGTGEWAGVAPHDALPEPGCLRRVLDAVAERPRAGLVSAEYGDASRPVVDRYFGGILVPARRGEGWEPVGHPHGTLMLARRACLAEVGLFDERYFAYCEEADLGVRATRAGWEVGIVWGALVRNPSVGVDVRTADYLQLRNSLLLVRTHSGRYPAAVRLAIALGDTAVRGLVPSRRPPLFSLPGRALAVRDFLRGRSGPPPFPVADHRPS